VTVYLWLLSAVSWASLVVASILIWGEILGRPKVMVCDCRMFPERSHHLDTPFLLGASISCAGISVTDLSSLVFSPEGWRWMHFGFAILYALWSLSYYRRWKKHKRGGKHGSLAKLLAKVKITVAGLRVVPVRGET